MTTKLKSIGAAALLRVVALVADSAVAQNYPTKAIRMVVPFAPGGGTDIMPRLEERLGQQIVVENRTGGGGYIGAEHVAKASPDGHTLLFTAANIVMSLELFPKQPVDPLNDFYPVARDGALVVDRRTPKRVLGTHARGKDKVGQSSTSFSSDEGTIAALRPPFH